VIPFLSALLLALWVAYRAIANSGRRRILGFVDAARRLEAHLVKLCNAIGLPPMLCVFMVLGVCVGLLGIVRIVNHTVLTTAMVLGTR
jgi:hypothetical protein